MALEYTLELATELEPAEVEKALITLGFEADAQSGRLVASGVTATTAKETDLGRSIVKDAYRIEPTVYVKFRLDKFEAWDSGVLATVKAALELPRKTQSNGILLFNGETPVLMSVAGRVTLNSGNDFWQDPSRLALVDEPYEMRAMASL